MSFGAIFHTLSVVNEIRYRIVALRRRAHTLFAGGYHKKPTRSYTLVYLQLSVEILQFNMKVAANVTKNWLQHQEIRLQNIKVCQRGRKVGSG